MKGSEKSIWLGWMDSDHVGMPIIWIGVDERKGTASLVVESSFDVNTNASDSIGVFM